MSFRPLPRGRLRRGLGMARAALGGAVGALGGEQRLLEHSAEILGELRGLGTKVGQMGGALELVLPERGRVLADVLAKLQNQASRSDPEEVRALVEAELGAPVAQLFASFEAEPFASASIGQVHRAHLHDGREVAVKVQHPGVEQALREDLEGVGNIEWLMRRVAPSGGTEAVQAHIRGIFLAELDYRAEAAAQGRAADLFEGDADIFVPRPILTHSSARVLCTPFLRGLSLRDPMSETARSRASGALWRFYQEGAVELGAWVADPHPGNFLISPEGVVRFLDFGCLEPVPDRDALGRFLRAAKEGKEGEMDQASAALFGAQGPMGQRLLRLLVAPAAARPGQLFVEPALLKELAQVMPAAKEESLKGGGSLSPTLPLYCRLALVLLADLAALGGRRG